MLIFYNLQSYDGEFELVIPDNLFDLIINNLSVFGKIILLSLISFGILGIGLVGVNLVILSVNLTSLYIIYGVKKFAWVVFYGIFEISFIPISLLIIVEIYKIYKTLYSHQRISSNLIKFIGKRLDKILKLASIGVGLIIGSSILEFIVGNYIW